MDQFNIRVDDETKQTITAMIDEWRNENESNGDVFSRIVSTAKAVGQDKPVELVKALSGSRQTVNVLLRQINSVVEVEQTQIEDLKKQLSEKEKELEDQSTDWKKKFLELGDSNREKVNNLQTKIDELKDWLRIATEEKAKLEQARKGDQDALESYRESVADKKAMLEKMKNDLDERNSKLVELQKLVDQSQEKLASELRKVAEKHQAVIKQNEEQHQQELEQLRVQYEGKLKDTEDRSTVRIDQILAEQAAKQSDLLQKQQEDLYKEFADERKGFLNKLDKKQELLDNLKDQLSATRENNAVLKQQLSQLTQQG